MRKVIVHFHNDDVDTQEQAYLFGGNVLLSDYGATLYFRVVTVGYRQGEEFYVRDYKAIELPVKAPAHLIEDVSLLDYVRLTAK
jgi:hypothetical protein